jgi:type IV pilus assembly protein PilP
MTGARISLLLVGLLVGACGDGTHQELQQWMAEQKAQAKPQVTPLSEPKKYSPQQYLQEQAVEPFSSQKLALAFKQESGQSVVSNKLIAPELIRRKEPLEAYPLDTMVMVGSLNRGGQQVALIRVDRLLYQVQAGNYLGQNYGRIMKISENEVALREIVQDTTGDWIERTATLQLQERAK